MVEDTKWAIRSRASKKDRHYNGQKKKGKKRQTTIYNRKLKIDQYEPHKKPGVN